MFRFERLTVWQKAIGFADLVYEVTAGFPGDERFGLTSQLRRAAVSVSANIAEGSGRSSDRDNSHFIQIAYGSLMEVLSLAHVAKNQKMLSDEQLVNMKSQADEIAKMLSGLRKSLEPKPKPKD